MSRAVHYMPHTCCGDDCDCETLCHTEGDLTTTGVRSAVTCKNCLRGLAANDKRLARSRARTNRALAAWAEECAH